jgi:hypothetical protein
MNTVTAHMIRIFLLYVGTTSAIEEHTSDYYRGRVSRYVYIYPNPLDHTLKNFMSIEYEFGIR